MSSEAANAATPAKKLGGITGKGFLPGKSGNPSGRPKKTAITDAYAKLVDRRLPDDIRRKLGLPSRATWADALALGQMRSAVKGKTDAAREIREALEGKATQKVQLETDVNVRLARAEQRWRERKTE